MNMSPKKRHLYRGFTLIITISLLVLLTIIGIGMLSLSTISLRSGTEEQARSLAQANARFALMMAIGELQKQLGPDQRISANGAILAVTSVKNPHWTGVWDSWAAGTAVPASSKLLPSTTSEHSTIAVGTTPGMAPTYAANRSDMFQSWLVSLYPSEMIAIDSARNLVPDTSIQLVGKGSLGNSAPAEDYVTARLLDMTTSTASTSPNGRYAWWVGDESQKVRIMDDSYLAAPAATTAEKIFVSQSPGSTGTKTIAGLQNITQDSQLDSLPSRSNLDLLTNVVGRPGQQNFHSATPFSYSVLADTREGGLKRDLSTILEQSIDIANTGDPYMLYRFDPTIQQCVPIQDLAAFYQLYDQSRYAGTPESWRQGVIYNSTRIPNAVQIIQPELGALAAPAADPRYLREYQRMYKSSVPIKVQILISLRVFPIVPAPLPGLDTHYIRLYMSPSVTLWNPTNLPMVMNLSANNNFSQQMRLMSAGFNLNWIKNGAELATRKPLSLAFAAMGGDNANGRPGWGNAGGKKATTFDMYFGSPSYPVTFEPGEVRVFSYDPAMITATPFQFRKNANDSFVNAQQAAAGWNPGAFFPMANSIWGTGVNTLPVAGVGTQITVKATDQIAIRLSTDLQDNTDYSHDSEWPGAAFSYMMIQKNHQSRTTNQWGYRNYPCYSRMYSANTAQANYPQATNRIFNDRLIRKGFPTTAPLPSRSVSNLITTSLTEPTALFQFALMAGTETSEASNPFAVGGRKFAGRPFLHSSPIAPPIIDKDDNNSLYNYGLSWWIQEVNSPLEANVQVAPGNRRGYYGGGNSLTYGTTHVVQQEIPVTPPISIASLTHAHLGGFSLANAAPNLTSPVVSAVGAGGLFPFTMRAIGNSYAHPLIAPDQAYRAWDRQFDGSSAAPRTVTLADHSYLANKALWDEYFFTSITPQNLATKVFGTTSNRTAKQVADAFFFTGGKLPNRRIIPYTTQLNQAKLDTLFTQNTFTNGLADKIAAHMMVEGPFNINSTSVEAWKVLFSSMRGKAVTYLDRNLAMSGAAYAQSTPAGVPVSGLGLPLTSPQTGSSADPVTAEQWLGWKELTDIQINELAVAMVSQVKLRGPFLSLSDFVNRRLDATNRALSVKGALQAAIDDPAVSINAGFRSAARQMSAEDIASMTPAFPEALAGPIAYGSVAYVNQSDILRNFAEQLTPRGDTFVIRSYGESLDANGKVNGRAWCEAVIQRLPEYTHTEDEPHVKQALLTSPTNQLFGRKLKIVSFRWLNSADV